MSQLKTEAEVIEFAVTNFGPLQESTANPGLLLAALEAISLNGFDDESGGNVEYSVGYFYRVGKWIVTIDNQGFKDIETFEDQSAAEHAFQSLYREAIQDAGEDS